MFELDKVQAKITSFNPRAEKHGEENVPGDEVVAQRAAEYIRLRGDALPYKLVCVDDTVFFEDVRSCRVCGCTDGRACPGGCSWAGPDLCSACAEDEDLAQAEPA